MPVSMSALADDLAAETAELRALLAPLDEPGWLRETPAAGWRIADHVSHLAYFDDVAVLAATDADAFATRRRELIADGQVDPDVIAQQFRTMSGAELLAWFDRARARAVTVFGGLEPAARVLWFGPTMSTASALTARIMETWAHGQDIADTLGAKPEPTDRLRHVAHIGVGARPFSYLANGLQAPATPIRVELVAPSGALWTWGPAEATDRVSGQALDFCLVVTQRRHRADATLEVTGPAAAEWMAIAQAFAGAPGTGRTAGQFG